MSLSLIPVHRLRVDVCNLFDRQWMVLTAGDHARGEVNPMTISWGTLGWIWQKPIVQVMVRPQRHTHQFMERFDTFTLSAFGEHHRRALNLLGRMSGREGDKVAAAGLTLAPSEKVAAPAFAEAELVLECRKIYGGVPFDPTRFLDPSIAEHYPEKDYHTVYYGEIVLARGVARYSSAP